MGTADDAKRVHCNTISTLSRPSSKFYRAQHLNRYPTIQSGALPQLSSATNAAGEMGVPGRQYPLGPYVTDPPMNPFDGSKKVVAVDVAGQKPTSVIGTLGGWQYDESTGILAE